MQSIQADDELKEEHLLNFVVNSLEKKFPLDLEENAEVMTEELYEVLAGASAGGTSRSITSTRKRTTRPTLIPSVDILPISSILIPLKRLGIRSFNGMSLRRFQIDWWEVVADLHLDPFYGDENETESLYFSQSKRGATAFHAYLTLYARD